MKRNLSIISYLLLCILSLSAQTNKATDSKVKYQNYLKELKSGNSEIDYLDFRNSFYDSGQVLLAMQASDSIKIYRIKGLEQLNNKKFAEAEASFKRSLQDNYTDPEIHFFLSFVHHLQGNEKEQNLHRSISEGLQKTILESGDGKTPETAYKVNMVTEEYALLRLMRAKTLKQTLTSSTPVCDLMEVEINGQKENIYFDITRVMETYKQIFK